MTRAGRFLRNLLERLLGRYYEGPHPPRRLAEEVKLFRIYYPGATAEQWSRFATRLASNAYEEGFVRGYEWQERGWDGPVDDPEQLLELEAHDWSLAEQNPTVAEALAAGIDPNDPFYGSNEQERARFLDDLGQRLGTHRVTVTDERGRRIIRP